MLSKTKAVVHRYNRLAANYDERWRGYLDSTLSKALEIIGPCLDDIILDAGGGTGLLPDLMLRNNCRFRQYVIADLSPKMLQRAVKTHKGDNNISYTLCDSHKLPFLSGSFTTVVSNSSLHYHQNLEQSLSEFYRVLQPSGKLIIVDWCNDPLYFKLITRTLNLTSMPYLRPISSKDLSAALNATGFKVEHLEKWYFGIFPLMILKVRAVLSNARLSFA